MELRGRTYERSKRLNIRVTPDERAAIEKAAEASGKTLTEYVVGKLLKEDRSSNRNEPKEGKEGE